MIVIPYSVGATADDANLLDVVAMRLSRSVSNKYIGSRSDD